MGNEGALAGAGGPDDAHKVALFHRKAHIVQRSDRVGHAGVVDVAQMFYFDDICHLRLPPLLQKLVQSLCAFAGVDDALRHRDAGLHQLVPQLCSLRHIQMQGTHLLGLAEHLFGVPSITTWPLLITSTRSACAASSM